ncbi:hypothetical protein HYDPIDRAFT_104810 [Hydnomerulius pinastri MD-312]|nr:hypothetical protein HYDPIDRAFT_104810 [Hydnomerulius pinastri MD-312]
MALSASDIRSALSLPSAILGPSQPRKPQGHSTKKPEGISRELYSLIGPSAPSLAAHLAKPRLKQKPSFGGGGKVKWEHRPFRNGARTDSLQLSHWVKANEPDGEYQFAKYNIQPTPYTYSQDEYTRFLEDKDWTKEETDYLFNIVQEFDLRWYVVHDRYEYSDGPTRAIEDLKDRYYSVCRKLIRNRPWAGDESSKSQLLNSYQFDKEREKMRKNYIASLEERTPEEIAEEEALFIELKRLEQNERKFKKERDDLLRTLLGIDSGLPDIIAEEDGPSALSSEGLKRKKKGSAVDTEVPPTPTNIISLGPPAPKRAQSAKSAAYDAQHCIVRVEPPATTTNTTKVTHVPVHLRSFKLPIPKAAIAPKVTQALTELGISHSRLVMPTRENCGQLESLLEATSTLVETKKVVDRVEQDIRVLKARLGMKVSEGGDGDGKEGTPMDVDDSKDDGGVDGEVDGRAQSVVSTRSGRGRKQVRRSVSVSSVDTSASLSTRAVTKRQKRS